MKSLLADFGKCQSGATAIEYGLIAALIGVAIITVLTQTSGGVKTTFTSVKHGMAKAPVL